MNKQRILHIVMAVLVIVNAVFLIMDHNWCALMWLICATLTQGCLYLMDKTNDSKNAIIKAQVKAIDDMDSFIKWLTNLEPWKQVKKARKEQEIASANCYHYINRINELKEENERYKVLVKNLIENKNTGVKNYARKSK